MAVQFEGPVVEWRGVDVEGDSYRVFCEGHYQGMVKNFAKRAMEESGIQRIKKYLGIKIHVRGTHATSLVGIAKSVMDAMTGVIYDDDILVRSLSMNQERSSDNDELTIELYRWDSGELDDRLLVFTIPGRPVPKGFVRGIWKDGFDPLQEVMSKLKIREDMSLYSRTPMGSQFPMLRRKDMKRKALWIYLEVESERDFGDIDNLLRMYVMALQENRVFGFDPEIRGIDVRVRKGSISQDRVRGYVFARESSVENNARDLQQEDRLAGSGI